MNFSVTIETIFANLLGGLIFFWVDKYIFKNTILAPLWEIQEEIKCVDCGQVSKGFRLVKTTNYDKTQDKNPEFRCEECSSRKLKKLKERGIKL
jgi:DNA-directed RNA polymerase subunit RPC12/RpoP